MRLTIDTQMMIQKLESKVVHEVKEYQVRIYLYHHLGSVQTNYLLRCCVVVLQIADFFLLKLLTESIILTRKALIWLDGAFE